MKKTSALKKDDKIRIGEFWTAKQRQAHSIHYTVSYRAAFKPELPAFFFKEFLHKKKSVVLDPFGGRGTTVIQANLDGHYGIHNDINPLSIFLAESRKTIPPIEKIVKKLETLNLSKKLPETEKDEDLLNFFHKDTLNEIKNIMRIYADDNSPEMKFIMLTALSRLHGHSTGFFSVYTFPQLSISPIAQKRNNEKKGVIPEYKDVKSRIIKKMKTDLSEPIPPFYHEFTKGNIYCNENSTSLESIKTSSVDIVITSPPFLDKVDYIGDNWMKAWFLGISKESTSTISMLSSVDSWSKFIKETLVACSRVMKKNASLIMEVGDVRYGKEILNLDEVVLNASRDTTLEWFRTYINTQKFTKHTNSWNIKNNEKGTNSNRCVVLENRK